MFLHHTFACGHHCVEKVNYEDAVKLEEHSEDVEFQEAIIQVEEAMVEDLEESQLRVVNYTSLVLPSCD